MTLPRTMCLPATAIALVVVAACGGCDRSTPEVTDFVQPADPASSVALPEQVTFSEHIAPILFDQCAVCHRPGESAPFSLLSYEDARRRATQIAEVTASRFMPPWLPAPGHGHFAGERRLSDKQIALLDRWARQGALQGDPTRAPPPPSFTEGWQLGPPDLVVRMSEPYTLPADGRDVYRNFVVPVDLDEPRYVRAMELRPGNQAIVHHAFLLIDSGGNAQDLDAADPGPGYEGMSTGEGVHGPGGHFISWQPGKMAHPGSDDMSWLLEPGTDIVLQLHMQPTGKPETIQAEVGLYFASGPPTKFPVKICLRSLDIDIPPGESDYTIEESYTLPVDVEVLAILPHAHYLGKRLEAFATLPDDSVVPLLLIPQWDFNWQGDYRYAQPVYLPEGARLTMRFSYDNSSANPRNPNRPPRPVRYGLQSTDEMGELWLQLLPRDKQALAKLKRDYGRTALLDVAKRARMTLRDDPNNVPALVSLGKSLLAMGDPVEARQYFAKAVGLDASHAEAHCMLGMIQVSRREIAQARESFQNALSADADCFGALNALGLLALQANDPKAATKHFRQALRLKPRNPAVLHNLGLALLRDGQPAEAIQYLQQSLQVRPHDPQTKAHLEQARSQLEARGERSSP